MQHNEKVIVDVRSPAEFKHAHIPGAVNIPLFDDAERKTVGIAYKQQGQAVAVQTGLDIAGKKLSAFVADARAIAKNNTLYIHCWRGGMRSRSMATLFDFAGITTYVLRGGYKNYRREVRSFFNYPFPFIILGGKTGSGKTEVLHALQQDNEQIIDLEAIAKHKGSAFGALGENEQPSTEQFENEVFEQLRHLDPQKHIWLEDESHLIGTVFIPEAIWKTMRNAPVVYLDIPANARAEYLVSIYGKYPAEEVETALHKIAKRLGGQHVKETLEFYRTGKLKEATEKVLVYYDKTYAHGLSQRNPNTIFSLPFEKVSPENIAHACKEFAATHLHKTRIDYY